MAEASAHGTVRCGPSGDRRGRTQQDLPPPPSSAGDLISALPDAVFSFLPILDVVKTSALSRRCTSTADLLFDDGIDDVRPWSASSFSSLVDGILLRSTCPAVKRFCLFGFACNVANSPKLGSWLRFAEACRVEHLCLRLMIEPPFLYTLPPFLYCLSWLVRLDVNSCCFSLGRTIRWPCLKGLSIEHSKLSDDILKGIFRGSPVLESLVLRRCWGMENIKIDSTSVKELALLCSVEKILAPHLLSLQVSGYNHVFRLDYVSSLVETKLVFCIQTGGPGFEGICCEFLKELLEKLRRVPTITIGD